MHCRVSCIFAVSIVFYSFHNSVFVPLEVFVVEIRVHTVTLEEGWCHKTNIKNSGGTDFYIKVKIA